MYIVVSPTSVGSRPLGNQDHYSLTGSTECAFDHISLREVRLRLNTHPVVFFFLLFSFTQTPIRTNSTTTTTEEEEEYDDDECGRGGRRRSMNFGVQTPRKSIKRRRKSRRNECGRDIVVNVIIN